MNFLIREDFFRFNKSSHDLPCVCARACVCVCMVLAGRWCLIFSGHLDWLSLASFKRPHTHTQTHGALLSYSTCSGVCAYECVCVRVHKGSDRWDILSKQVIYLRFKRSQPLNLDQEAVGSDILFVFVYLCVDVNTQGQKSRPHFGTFC